MDYIVKKDYLKKEVETTQINELRGYIKEGDLFQLEANPAANNREFYIKRGLKYKLEIK